ncbi:AMP-binding protein [Streptomyces sp. NPDC053474]|uniref:AMP-binding protein n=1 Tax=Streptomyces sp. NPDC053474 TaxID=3365704 RepID=UPI0037D556A0
MVTGRPSPTAGVPRGAPPGPEGHVASGPPLSTLSDLLGGPRIDDLLRRAAASAPGHPAVRTDHTSLCYAELDALADRFAAALHAIAGGPGGVVALTTALDAHFAPAFFGTVRSGNTPALVNPLLREAGLAQVLGICRARVAVVAPEVYERLAAVRGRLPELRHLVLTHRDAAFPKVPAAVPTLAELAAGATGAGAPRLDPDPEAVACVQFTSGTTGAPKAVLLSHRNLTVNAAQSARAHGLDASSVVFDWLPTFHLMHLTITVAVAGTLVLCPGADPADAMATAHRYRATHCYSLPVRLARLAVHPRLPELACPSLRAVLSGGSTLAPGAVTTLGQHFDVPVVQGYGLQETSPSTHFDSLVAPRPGSSGRPVAGTECRIVDVDTGSAQPPGAKGEIQVRGPQLMKGYLGRDLTRDTDADGWFATGDIGVQDDDGCLYVVDRIKDVFKRDNWLVSPTEIERALLRHPAVADCAVVDRPHAFSGAVAQGFVVFAPGSEGTDPAVVAAEVNARLPYYEHLEHIEPLDHVPRSPTGKVLRQELRARLRPAPLAAASPLTRPPSSTTQPKEKTVMHHFVNRFTVTGDAAEFERLLAKITDHMAAQPGFRSYRLYRSRQDPTVYVETAAWTDSAAHERATGADGFRGPVMEVMKLAKAEPGPYQLITERTDAAEGNQR